MQKEAFVFLATSLYFLNEKGYVPFLELNKSAISEIFKSLSIFVFFNLRIWIISSILNGP